MVFLVLPFLLVWLLYSLWVAWRQPMQRPITVMKVLLWALTLASVGAVHWVYARSARQEADSAVAAVLDYQRRHGNYPVSLADVGVPTERGRGPRYSFDKGRPTLFYPSTFIVFDQYLYDFDAKEWVYRAD